MEPLNAILQRSVAQGSEFRDKLLGAALVVTNKKGVIYAGGAGRISIEENSPRFTSDSFSWVASLTKLPVTICLLQLVEQGKIKLDDDLRGLVPELGEMQVLTGFTPEEKPILENNDQPITLQHLLTHTVGLGYDTADPDLQRWTSAIGRTVRMNHWNKAGVTTPLKFTPGNGWCYGSAMDWAGIALEKVTGKSIGEYLKEHVLDPLGMKDTGFHPETISQTANRTVEVVLRDSDTGGLVSINHISPKKPEMECGGAGIWTTANDYARLLHALLQTDPGVVSVETVGQMFTPQLNQVQSTMLEADCRNPATKPSFGPEYPSGLNLNHGFGGVIAMGDIPGQRRQGSLSWSGACNPRWWIDRKSGIAGVFMVNIFPHGEAVASQTFVELEKAVYEHFVK